MPPLSVAALAFLALEAIALEFLLQLSDLARHYRFQF
jgi:hypothetical protein